MSKEGVATIAAITPNSAKLSKPDAMLMMQVAMGGMMQLETGKVAVGEATNSEVREMAQAQAEEQTGLAAKLREIATAKGMTLPGTPDAKTREMVIRMQGMSGAKLDRHYVQMHAVKGHETLDKVMTKVKSRGQDENLMAVAKAAHLLVKTHLKVACEIQTKLRGDNAMNSTR